MDSGPDNDLKSGNACDHTVTSDTVVQDRSAESQESRVSVTQIENATNKAESKTKENHAVDPGNKSFKERAKSVLKSTAAHSRQGLSWMWKDVRKSHLLWVKVIFLFQSASLVTLYPYLTIHMRSLGFSIEDTGVVNTVVPAADVFGPPLAGLLADKIGNFRFFMAVVTFLNGLSSLLLISVSRVDSQIKVSCSLDGSCFIKSNQSIPDIQLSTKPDIRCNSDFPSLPAKDGFPSNWSAQLIPIVEKNSTDYSQTFDCTLRHVDITNRWVKSFSVYLSVRVVLDILRASSLMLFEGAVVSIIKEHGGDYGIQKLFGTLGSVIFSPLAGLLIDINSSEDRESEDYSGIIILYFVLRTITTFLILKLNLDFKPPAKKVFRDLRKVIFKARVIIYLVAFLVAGAMWGFLETFLFWYLEDLGSTKLFMGIALAFGTLTGVPLTMCSKLIIKKLGHIFLMALTLVLYAIRMSGYAMAESANYAMLLESLKPFCTSLLLISTMTFVKDVSPVTTLASVEGIFGSLYFGIGRGLGGLFGAFLWDWIGPRMTFFTLASTSLVTALTFTVTSLMLEKKHSAKFIVNQAATP